MRTTRHLPRRLAPLALVSLLALGACAGPDAEFDDAGTSGSGGTSQASDEAGAAPSSSATEKDAAEKPAATRAKDPSAYTVPYANEYKTIVLMDRSQVEALTGTDLSDGVEGAQQAMTQEDTWSGSDTKADADVITQAAERESDRIHRVLNEMVDGRDVELRLYVAHHEHAHVAHFGEDDDD